MAFILLRDVDGCVSGKGMRRKRADKNSLQKTEPKSKSIFDFRSIINVKSFLVANKTIVRLSGLFR